jgi:hypothetical protein
LGHTAASSSRKPYIDENFKKLSFNNQKNKKQKQKKSVIQGSGL